MKIKTNLIILIGIIAVGCSSINKNDTVFDNQLLELLENKNFFELREKLETSKERLSRDRQLYYEAYCARAFDETQKSNECVNLLLKKHKNQLNDTLVSELLAIKSSNFIRRYQYKDAADIYKNIVEEYSHVLDSSDIDDYQNSLNLFGTLASVKPQIIHKQKDTKIPSYRNQFNHLMATVRCGKITDEFIFDTGAGLSTISNSFAEKMGLAIYESDIKVVTGTSITVQTKLAVADSLYVGDILFENIVFLVLPDEHLAFPSINYEIHGIIGFPVIHQMGEIKICKDGILKVPLIPQSKQLENMFLDGLRPVVQLFSDNDTLLLAFDTGATKSYLSKKYYDAHKHKVEMNGKLKVSQHGSAGGIIDVEEYILKDFPYTIGSKSNVLPQISVVLEEFEFTKHYDGNLGQDVFTQFNEMTLNFQHMFIDFE